MIALRATYRLQFRNGMTFDAAAGLVPYLAELGVSHLYASPISSAAPGSTHGYDVTDAQELEPELGGEAGFKRLAAALRQHGLGLMLDIVPNHMAVSTANPWWRDVLKHGRHSRYADHFDIDWRAPKLLMPVLGEPYGEALEQGLLQLALEQDEVVLRYQGLSLPLAPGSLEDLAGEDLVGEDLVGENLVGEEPTALPQRLEAINGDREKLHRLHEMQVWQLAFWRLAREALTYRRFFEIADLIGVRVEDPEVFEDLHALPLRLLQEGDLDLLRVDHIDGLADPRAYLERLEEESGGAGVVVEKILGPEEELPPDWSCLGTTGYEIACLITSLQVARAGEGEMTEAWRRFSGAPETYNELVKSSKRRILTGNLAGELAALVRTARALAARSLKTRDFGPDALRLAVLELCVALPIYRTYITAAGPSPEDEDLLRAAAEAVKAGRIVEEGRVMDFLLQLLLDPAEEDAARLTFIRRFQQITGPLTAKAVEDTAFYRYNRLIALNEVGGEPGRFGLAAADFHASMKHRAERWPQGLSATATHDTKRGEDSRARLAVLSEMPREWHAAVERWHRQLAANDEALVAEVHREDAWLFYQALLGAWPETLSLEKEEGLQELAERLLAFMTKALREGKLRSSWTAPASGYEDSVERFVRSFFETRNRPLLRDIRAMVTRLAPAALVNSLSQLTLKLTLPGVPDLYQGTELPDYSLVDPDNRRTVDFARRRRLLAELPELSLPQIMARWREGLPKLWLTARLLELRKQQQEIFAGGDYEALEVVGDEAAHVLAFARSLDDQRRIIVAMPRQVLHHLDPWGASWLSGAFARTRLNLGGDAAFRSITGGSVQTADISLATLWQDAPVAVLFPAR